MLSCLHRWPLWMYYFIHVEIWSKIICSFPILVPIDHMLPKAQDKTMFKVLDMTLAKFVRCPRPYPKESYGVFPMPKSIFLVIGSQEKIFYFKSQAQAIPFMTFLELHIHFFVATISIHVSSNLFLPLLLSFLVCHHHHQDDHNIVQWRVVIENMNIPLMVIRVVFNNHNHESQRKILKTILHNEIVMYEQVWVSFNAPTHHL